MIIYIALAAFPVLLGAFFPDLYENKKQKRQFYLICGFVMLLIMGLRHYSLGSSDTLNYYNAMKRASVSISWENFYNPDYFELGAQVFIYSLSRIFKDPQWLLVITSLMYIVAIFYFIDNNSDDIPLSITLYIALGLMIFNLQGMRQSIAMSICLFAYEQAKRKHLIRFLVLIIIAVTFHQTAIVFLPVYIVCRLRYSHKNMLIMSLIALLIITNASRITFIANSLFDRSYNTAVDQGGFVAMLIYIIILIITLLFDYRLKDGNTKTPLLYILIIGLVSYMLRYFGTLAAERISFYFMFSQLVLLPNSQYFVVKQQRKIMRIIIFILAVALMAYRLHGSEFVPYRFSF